MAVTAFGPSKIFQISPGNQTTSPGSSLRVVLETKKWHRVLTTGTAAYTSSNSEWCLCPTARNFSRYMEVCMVISVYVTRIVHCDWNPDCIESQGVCEGVLRAD